MSDDFGCTAHSGGDGKGYSVPALRADILTAGLNPEMGRQVEIIMGCFDRASDQMEKMVTAAGGNVDEAYQALWMVLTNITNGSAMPIMEAMSDGHHPICAFKGVMAGIAGLAFMAGVESNKGSNGETPAPRAAQPRREEVPNAPSDDEFASLMEGLFTGKETED